MLFSSNIFLFAFLPIVLFVYYVLLHNIKLRNLFLLFASFFFYAWGEPTFVLIMLLSIVANYGFALWVARAKAHSEAQARVCLVCMVAFNLSLFFVFKYLGFFMETVNTALRTSFPVPHIRLPIGISFFTFQAMSYVIDVYRGQGELQKNPLNVGLYIAFFPQLIAGPIVRYKTISDQILHRHETMADFSAGTLRFTKGLAKKVLFSNTLSIVADKAFSISAAGELSVAMAWLGALAYTMQIYYDFSGYSDMAIGLGKMFGFHFEENFNYPYAAGSITDFWRRWHISLGTWFRDYVYIPLGGSRNLPAPRIALNLFIVWLLTGIWHGANWTFLVWGLYYYALLVVEKFLLPRLPHRVGGRTGAVLRHLATFLLVLLGWVVFRAESLGHAGQYLLSMAGLAHNAIGDGMALLYLRENLFFFLGALLLSVPLLQRLLPRFAQRPGMATAGQAVYAVALFTLFLVSVSYLVKGSYNPFIYFNF